MLTPRMADTLVMMAEMKNRKISVTPRALAKLMNMQDGNTANVLDRLIQREYVAYIAGDYRILKMPEPLALRACGFSDAFTAAEIYAGRSGRDAA